MIMINKIKEALEKVDVLVTTGSVSMGDKDLLKPILEIYFKATIHFGTFLNYFRINNMLNTCFFMFFYEVSKIFF